MLVFCLSVVSVSALVLVILLLLLLRYIIKGSCIWADFACYICKQLRLAGLKTYHDHMGTSERGRQAVANMSGFKPWGGHSIGRGIKDEDVRG